MTFIRDMIIRLMFNNLTIQSHDKTVSLLQTKNLMIQVYIPIKINSRIPGQTSEIFKIKTCSIYLITTHAWNIVYLKIEG